MPSLEAIRTLRIQASTSGVDEATASLGKLGTSYDNVSKSAAATATVTETSAKHQLSLADAVSKAERQLSAAARAQQDYEKLQQKMNLAVQQNPALQQRANDVLELARQKIVNATGANDNFAKSTAALASQFTGLGGTVGQVAGNVVTFANAAASAGAGSSKSLSGFATAINAAVGPIGLLVAGVGLAITAYEALAPKAKSLNDLLSEQARLLGIVKTAFDVSTAAAARWGDTTANITKLQVLQQQAEAVSQLQTETAKAARAMVTMDIVGGAVSISEQFKPFSDAIFTLKEGWEQGAPSAKQFADTVAQIGLQSPALRATASALISLVQSAITAEVAKDKLDAMLRVLEGVATATDKANLGIKTAVTETRSAFDRAVESVTKHVATMQADVQATGQGVAVQEELRVKAQLTAAALLQGADGAQKHAAQIDALSKSAGQAKQQLAEMSAGMTADFAKQTVFLDDTEKSIASIQFSLHGTAWKDFMNDGLSSTMRVTAALKDLSDAAGSALSGFAQDLANGSSLTESLVNAAKKLDDILIDLAAKKVVSGVLSGLFDSATQTAGMTAGATTAATILTAAGTSVAAAIVAGATEAAGVLGVTIPTAAATLPVAGGATGAEVAVGGAAAGAALAAGGTAAGAALWGPIALLGAAVAAGAFLFGGDSGPSPEEQAAQQAMQAKQSAVDSWRDMINDADKFIADLAGDNEGSLTSAIADATSQMQQYIDAATAAGDSTSDLTDALTEFIDRSIQSFNATFSTQLAALNSGQGLDGPASDAISNIKDIGQALLGFLNDTELAGGDLDAATAAVSGYLETILLTPKPLSDVQEKLVELNASAAQLRDTLSDFSSDAQAVADVVENELIQALADLADEFTKGLRDEIRDASGKGFVNDFTDLFATLQSNLKDAASLGIDPSLVFKDFRVQAQQIVDGAELSGDAFNQLIEAFPRLSNVVSEFTETVDDAAVAQDAQNLKQRLLTALVDDSTLEGQLALFDQQANLQRQQEAEQGNQNILLLEATLSAERLNIIDDFNQQAIEQSQELNDQIAEQTEQLSRNIDSFLAGLNVGPQSPLSPTDQFNAAAAAFNQQIALAQGGDFDAANSITQYASNLLDAAQAVYASSGDYQTIFNQVTAVLQALPDQVSSAQMIVNAIADTTSAVNDTTSAVNDTTTAVDDTKVSVDATSGILNLIKAATSSTKANTDSIATLQDSANDLQSDANSLAHDAKLVLDSQKGLLDQLVTLNTTSKDSLGILESQFISGAGQSFGFTQYVSNTGTVGTVFGSPSDNMLLALEKITINTFATAENTRQMVPTGKIAFGGALAAGGWVKGPGTPTSDSIFAGNAWVSNGEFVVNAASARMYGGMLEGINAGRSLTFPMPANDNGAVIAELRAANARLGRLEAAIHRGTTVNAAGHMSTRSGIDTATRATRAASRDAVFETKKRRRANG